MTGESLSRMGARDLRTKRLLLRHWSDADRDPWAAMHADEEVMRYLGPLLTRAQTDALLDALEARLVSEPFGVWAVEVLGTGEFIGCVGLSRPSFDAAFTPCVEVVWRLRRSAWGFGYATEAAVAAVTHGFESCGLEEIVSFTVVDNVRSRAVMEAMGMVRDLSGDFDHPRLAASDPLRPHVLYRMPRTG